MRAALHPFGLLDEHQRRTLDFGTGYAVERVARPDRYTLAQGPYVELGAYPLRTHRGEWTARAGLRTSVEALITDEGWGNTGYGASVALALEIASFAKGMFGAGGADGFILGGAHGEGGLGAFAGMSHRRFSDDSYWLASAGLSLRVPAVAGVICCMRTW
jgi:hypothetical protein